MRLFKKMIAGALAALMVSAPAMTTTAFANDVLRVENPQISVVRLGGSDRFETANLIADEGWKSAETVFLANSNSYADALAGTPLAYAYSAPILLTDGKKVSDSVKAEIKKLGAKNVYLLGGTAAISDDVMNDLKKTYNVTRIWGQTRYETALKIAEALEAKGQAPADIFIASGVNYPDALSASSAAAIKHAPILYSPANGKLDKASTDFIAKCKPYNVYILGGKAAVGEAAEDAAKKAGAQSVSRLGGTDRYDTSVKISKQFDPQYKSDTVCFATGKNFPDALAGSVLAAKESAPVLLTDNADVRKDTREYVAGRERPKAYVFGGKAVISDSNINGYIGKVTDVTASISAADKKAIEKAVSIIAGTEVNGNSNSNDLLYHTILCPPWVAEMGMAQDYFPVSFNIVEYSKTPDPRKQYKNEQKYAKCSGKEADKLLEEYFNLTAKHENNRPKEIYYQGGYYYLPFGGYGDMILPDIKLDAIYDIGDDSVYVKYSANNQFASKNTTMYDCCTLKKKTTSLGKVWTYVRNASSDYYYIAPVSEKPDDSIDLDKYVGTYSCDRCSIEVKKTGSKNELGFDIRWSSSAFEHEEWSMSGVIDEKTGKVSYSNAKRTNHVFYDSTGKENVKTVYTNGTGSFVFGSDGSLAWNNTDSDVSAKGMKFVKPSALPEIDLSKYVGTYTNDKCTVEVKKTENKNELSFAVSWNTKELTHEEWLMSGVMTDDSGKVAYYNAERTNHVLFDAIGKDNVTPVYINGTGSFAFGSDGSLVWNNDWNNLDKDLPAKDMKFGKPSTLPDVDLSKYTGRYGYSRCTIDVSESGEKNGLKFDIHWANSAADYYSWTMTGIVDPATASRVNFSDSVKTYHKFDETGKEVETKVVYKDGAGRFQFGDGYLLWQDEEESKDNEELAQTKFVRSGDIPADTSKEEAVKSAVYEMFKINFGKVVEEVKFNNVKVYTAEEIAADPALKDYKLGDKDIVFEVSYELKIIEGYEDIMQFTAATGVIDGQWVREKYNCGTLKYADGEYTVDNWGTGF